MPSPPRMGGPPVTNIRNTASPHWRGWLKPDNRCLVPFNSFSQDAPEPNPETKKKDVVWFALNDDRPLTAFAGIWTEFKTTGISPNLAVLLPRISLPKSTRKSTPDEQSPRRCSNHASERSCFLLALRVRAHHASCTGH